MEYYISRTNFTSSSKNITIVPAHASVTDLQNMVGSLPISTDSLLDCNLHPLPPLTRTNDNSTLLLGTDIEGRDIFRLLSSSIFHSLQFAFLTLVAFFISGISSGILLGYYSNQYFVISSIANYINKSLESVPLLLWILISLYALKLFLPPELQHDFAWPILFIILGQVSSPALSKMIRLKFIKLADDEFVVALKMLGLSNSKIIFNHIIPYYCLPIIFSQCAYIFAQALFLDITLTYLNVFFNEQSIGYRFLEAKNTISDYGYGYFIITSIIIFFIIAFMFSLIRLIDSYNE
jgi:ABC-type dipeptide/oligopeptide/nickel transport system permease subunit